MNIALDKPHLIIWASIVGFVGLALINFKRNIDLQLHDTYIVTTCLHLGIAISILLASIGFLYWLARFRKLIPWMTLFHIVATLVSFVGFIILLLTMNGGVERDFAVFHFGNIAGMVLVNLFLVSQVILLINILIAFFRKP